MGKYAELDSTGKVLAAQLPTSSGSIPAGVICMWAGLLANIPSGWALCDGLSGRPDLRSMFVKGAAAGQNPGATGGASSVNYTPQGVNSGGAVSAHSGANVTLSSHTGCAVADHAAHTHSVTSNVAVADHAAHTHPVTASGTNSTSTVTPSGTIAWPAGVPTLSGIAATFTGSPLPTHAHELPFQLPTTTTTRQIAAATFGTGTSRAATAVSAAGTANTTAAAVALSEAKSAGAPAGTVNVTSQGTVAWPAGVPVFTGASSTVGAQVFTGSQVTSGNPSAALSHAVTNNAVTSGGPSATLSHTVTQASDHTVTVTQPANHTFTQPTFTGTQAQIATEPAYYALAYIQKL